MLTFVTVLSTCVWFVCATYLVMVYFKKRARFKFFPKNTFDIVLWFMVSLFTMVQMMIIHLCTNVEHTHDQAPYLTLGIISGLPLYYIGSFLVRLHDKIEES